MVDAPSLLPLPGPLLALACAVVLLAGVVRGFSGFGFSALAVTALSLFLPPARVVPPIFVLEILASLSLLRGAWPHVDWRWMGWLMAGNVVCIPIGVAMLAWLDESLVRLLVGAMLLAAAFALRHGWQLARAHGSGIGLLAGVVSGVFNGIAAIGGMAVAVLFSAARIEPVALRATMIVFLLWTDVYSLAWAAGLSTADPAKALVGRETLLLAAWLLPPMLAGIALGQRAFAGTSPQAFRRQTLALMMLIASVTLVRGLWPMLAAAG